MRPDAEHDEMPERMRRDLKRLYRAEAAASPEMDAAVMSLARHRLLRARRVRFVARWSAAAAAMIIVAVAAFLALGRSQAAPARTAAKPADRQVVAMLEPRQVTILDAFALARRLEAGERAERGYDANSDGVVDRRDVDALAMRAVSLNRGAIQ